jgi:hypothetical protein
MLSTFAAGNDPLSLSTEEQGFGYRAKPSDFF